MYAPASFEVKCASSPNVPDILGHLGSVARSTCGCKATRIPTAKYSWRAMFPNSATASESPIAASPRGSGNCVISPTKPAERGFTE